VIEPAIGACPFNGIQRTRFFNDEDLGSITFRVEAKLAQVCFGDIATLSAKRQPILHRTNGIRQPQGILSLGLHEMKGQPLRAFVTDSGETDQFLDQSRQQALLIDGHR
jgi:hypothetical protein